MSHLCGWIRPTPNPVEAGETIALMRAQAPGTRAGTAILGSHAALAAGGPGPFHLCNIDGVLIGITGNPRWVSGTLSAASDPDALAATIAKTLMEDGPHALSRLQGRFTIALLDSARQQAFLAADRIGICRLYYYHSHDALIFGSRSTMMRAYPDVPAQINMQALFDYVYYHMVPAPFSIFAHHRRLEPGCCLTSREGSLDITRYWEPCYAETDRKPFTVLQKDFKELLHTAVKNESDISQVGAFLSGGTDSSTVAGVLSEVCAGKAKTYSIGFDQEGYDEIAYARIAARYFNTEHHEYYVTPEDVLNAIPLVAAAYDEPYGNASAVPTYYCATMATADGIQRLLGGDGGDELFGGNTRYAKQLVLSRYEHIPSYVRKMVLEPLFASRAQSSKLPLIRKVQSYVRQASTPMPARMAAYNLLQHFGPETVFTASFLDSIDESHPTRLLTELYADIRADTVLNRMLGVDLRHTLADNDLPKVTGMCSMADVDVAFPLLDDALVSFSMRLPTSYKLRGDRLRYFFKRALSDFLPAPILRKQKHGFGLPFGAWMAQHGPLRRFVHDNLSTLSQRGIIRGDFIDTLSRSLLDQHTAYYGTMIWLLLMLEQWFRKEHPDLRL